MRIVLCDDDSFFLDHLVSLILHFFSIKDLQYPEIEIFSNGESLLADQNDMDIVFLDIQLTDMSGIDVGNALRKKNKNVLIFVVTSYPEYLDDAMRFQVYRYLSKPIDQKRLFRNLNDAICDYSRRNTRIPIETKNGVITVNTTEIIAVEAQQRKVLIHTANQVFHSSQKFDFWKSALPQNCFFQTHRSYIINMEHVCNFDFHTVSLADNSYTAYLTRRRYHAFKEAYLFYLESMR